MATKPRPADDEGERTAEGTQAGRRPYAAPTLTEYGAIGKLTQAGSGGVGEGVAGMSMVMCL